MKKNRSKNIRDPIHNYIKLGALESELIDTAPLQRLRYVRQLGLNYLVYPGANHTRFEHSLGVCHLAGACVEEIQLAEYERNVLSAAALLHDIGHGPFSHLSDIIFQKHGRSHEEFTIKSIKSGQISGILEKHGITPADVCSVLQKKHKYSSLIASQLDVDKMDYLVRDAHYTGVAIGADLGRIVNTHRLVNDQIAITETSLPAVESLLISRFIMYPSVYNHRTSRIAERMLLRAFELSLPGGKNHESFDSTRPGWLDEFQKMMDIEFLTHLFGSNEKSSRLAHRVFERKLLKTVFEIPFERVGKDEAEKLYKGKEELSRLIEEQIAERFSVPRELVIIDVPELPIHEDQAFYIVTKRGELKTVDEVSKLAAILRYAQYDHWKIRVFLPEKFRDIKSAELEKIVGDFIELRDHASQRFLSEFV